MYILLISMTVVGTIFFLVLALGGMAGRRREEARRQVDARLRMLDERMAVEAGPDILREGAFETQGWLDRTLSALSVVRRLKLTIRQAGRTWNVWAFLGLSATLAAIGFGSAMFFFGQLVAAGVVGFGLGYLPFFQLGRLKSKRMAKFQRQFPDALDLITRALWAGHAFGSGMALVASEFEDPLGPEFAKAIEEMNFGIPLDRALWNLAARVDCPDLVFFIVSVIIQRETGGNMAEIVGTIATLIRDRFKLHGRIQVLSAEGRMSAWVLVGMPFLIGGVVYLINPGYMAPLVDYPVGRMLVGVSVTQMFIGIMVIRKLIHIKV